MESVITIGPLAISVDRAAALAAILAYFMLLDRLFGHGRTKGAGAWWALLAGLLAARLGYVAAHWSAYRAEPLSVLALWQGGFLPLLGAAAASAVLLATLRPIRRAAKAALVPLLLWAAWAGIVRLSEPAPVPLPKGLVLEALDGRPRPLDALKGKPFVLNLWASWCGPCRREMPMMADVARHSPVPVLFVNQGEDAERIRDFLAAQRLIGPVVLRDPGGRVGAAARAPGLPATLFVDARGVIIRRHTGEISRAALIAAIDRLEEEGR